MTFTQELLDAGIAGSIGFFDVLVGAALPWRVGVTEVDRQPELDAELRVLGRHGSLVLGQRATQLLGQAAELLDDRVADSSGSMPGRRWTVVDWSMRP